MANIASGEWDMEDKMPGGSIFSGQYLPAMALAFGSGLKAMGLWKQGSAAVEAAQRRKQAAEFEAKQLDVNAGQAVAAAQRDSFWKGVEGDRVISAIRARAGAGGSDPTILNLIAEASARRAYNMQAALYGGEDKARLMRMQASGKRYDAALGVQDAKSTRSSYRFAATGVLAEGAASLYSKYWPKNNAPTSGGAGPASGSIPDDVAFDTDPSYYASASRRGADTTGIRG